MDTEVSNRQKSIYYDGNKQPFIIKDFKKIVGYEKIILSDLPKRLPENEEELIKFFDVLRRLEFYYYECSTSHFPRECAIDDILKYIKQ